MDDTLKEVCDALDSLALAVQNISVEQRPLSEMYGWNHPAISAVQLANMPKELSLRIRQTPINVDADFQTALQAMSKNLKALQSSGNLPYMFNGNGAQAVPAYISTLDWVRIQFEQHMGWQSIIDKGAMPIQLTRKLRSIENDIALLLPRKEEIQNQINLIREATEAAESLPTDLASLKEARNSVNTITTDSAALFGKIDVFFRNAEKELKFINDKKAEADQLVKQCEESYRITTSTGLAGAFNDRAEKTSTTMWVWVGGLLVSLSIGAYLGAQRIQLLSNAIEGPAPEWSVIWMHIVLSILSIGAPLWFAWLATKQINQRFRMSEDYAYKASVAKAYEGYRRESVRLDPSFEARLFSSALTRLEEAPLRLVDNDSYGSPWHEFVASPPFQEALKTIPEFKDKFVEIAKQGISVFQDKGKSENYLPEEEN